MVDVIVVLSHLGLDVDETMIENTTGIDVVLGGHNHIVLQPPKQIQDCSAYSELAADGVTVRNFVLQDPTNGGQVDVGCTTNSDCGADGYCFGSVESIAMGTAHLQAEALLPAARRAPRALRRLRQVRGPARSRRSPTARAT